MGWSSIKNSVKRIGRQIGSGAEKAYKEYDRYTSSKLGAYLTPYLSMYDSDGRDALRKGYGDYLTVGASAVNPAAGAAVGTAVSAYDAHNMSPRPPAAFAPAADPADVPATPMEAAGIPWGLIGGAVAAIAVAGVVVLALRKGAR